MFFECEEGVVSIQVENATPYDVFTKCIGLPGLLSMMKTESKRYAAQNGGELKISEEELCVFLGVNILTGFRKSIMRHKEKSNETIYEEKTNKMGV